MQANIKTNKGTITLDLFPDKAELTVANFINLSKRGYYDNLSFHRVIDDFMIQGGCPNGTGTGGPGYQFQDEFHPTLKHDSAGILSMANSGPNTNGSQFFITHLATPWLDNNHTVFGVVVDEENDMGESDDDVWTYDSSALSSNGEYVFTIESESGSMDFDVTIDVAY